MATTTLETVASTPDKALPAPPRVVSIDIFRGLNVLLMILVNNLAEVRGLPWWTYHRGDVDGMTYVDMVFPGFLFLMGMAIPLSLQSRIARGHTNLQLCAHIVGRSISLLALGLFIANAPNVSARYTHISQTWWTALGFVAIALAWVRFPREARHKALARAIRYSGLALLAALFLIFRRVTPDGHPATLDFSYVEILGLLAWAYLLCSALYLLFAKRFALLAASFGVMVALNALSVLDWFGLNLPFHWFPFEAGLSSLTMSGVLASFVLLPDTLAPTLPRSSIAAHFSTSTFARKALWLLISAAVLFALGFALQPLGISKNADTPTWCLYCTAANLLIALLLYWVADIKGWKSWANFAKPAGQNPLLAYFLPFIPFLLPPLYSLTTFGTAGLFGVFKSVLLTALVLAFTTILVRRGLSLRL